MQPLQYSDKQDKAFAAHVEDLILQTEKWSASRFTGFLDLHQLTIARQLTANAADGGVCFYGGYPQAQRLMMGVFPPHEQQPFTELFPIAPVTIEWRAQDKLGHRDFLGSLLGLGLKRETIGDILLEPGLAVCFLTQTGRSTVLNDLERVGKCGVRVYDGPALHLPPCASFDEAVHVVASLRLDCIVAALANLSREKAAQLIRKQYVRVDDAVCGQVDRLLTGGETLSLRGYGKFIFEQPLKETKKGRLQILCKKFI